MLLSLTAGAVTYIRSPNKSLAPCTWFGIASACRPTILAIVLPFWIFGHRRLAVGTLAAAALFVGLTLPFVGFSTWRDYSAVVGHLERFIVNPDYFNQVHIDRIGSSTVEGYPLTELLPGRTLNLNLIGTAFPLLKSLIGVPEPGKWIILNKLFAAAYVVLIALLLRRIARHRVPPRIAMAYAALFVIGLDFFVPMRFAYAEVLYLLPLGLAFPILLRGSPRWMVLAIAVGLLLGIDRLPISDIWSSVARPVLVFGGVAGALIWYGLRQVPRTSQHLITGMHQ